jgi:signal transduction histidine kinase
MARIRRPRSGRLRNRLLIGVAAPIVVIAFASIVTYRALTIGIDAQRSVLASQVALTDANRFVRLVAEGESAQRAFVRTGDETTIQPYSEAIAQAPSTLAAVHAELGADPAQATRLDVVETAYSGWHVFSDGVIVERRGGDATGAIAEIDGGAGRQFVDRIRVTMDELIAAETSRRDAIVSAADSAAETGRTLALLAPVLAAYAAGLVALALTGRIVGRVEAIEAAATALAAGDLQQRTTPSGGDELESLARAFNTMAERLEALVGGERAARTEADQRSIELRAANGELEAFSYTVSHDLRGPLRAIDGFSEAILEESATGLDDAGRANLDRVRAASRRMGGMIDDLLELSRASRAELLRTNVDLSAVAGEVVAELRAADRGRAVEVDIEPGLRATGDARLIRVILDNLLGNAWKFCRDKSPGHISLHAAAGSDGRAFVVADDGAGFDSQLAGRLFAPFQRLHSGDDYPGTGIGLATVERIVQRHGGWVVGDGQPGLGARFTFCLDASVARPDTTEA